MKSRTKTILAWVGTIAICITIITGINLAMKHAASHGRYEAVEQGFQAAYDESWRSMELLNAEALKEIARINRLREANKDVKDIEWWKRLNKQGDEIKKIAEEIGGARDALIVIKSALYHGSSPTVKEFREARKELADLNKALKDIQKELNELRSL